MEIVSYEEKYNDSLKELLTMSFPTVDVKKFEKASDGDIELLCVSNNLVVGYVVFNRIVDKVRNISYCYANYVCVHNDYRNQHIATKLLEKAFSICKDEGISYIELTTNPTRVEAHELYKKLGFEQRNTDVFRKEIL